MYRVAFILFYVFTANTHASSIPGLEARNISDLAKPNGSKYEMEVVKTFWGKPHFMMQCIPPGSPIHKPFTIYVEILKTGKIGQLEFSVKTEVTECIQTNVRDKQFPKPKAPFVAKIELSFTE